METQYEYIHEKFRHLVSASNQERIEFLDEPRWIGYPVANQIVENLVSLMNKPKRPRMFNLLVVGDSNNGKTTLIRHFYDLYGQTYIDSLSDGVRPVILAEAPPSANEKELYISLLERFYVPYRATDSIAKLRYQTIHLFREYKVKMLIIDEFHSLLVGTPRLQRQVMNAIKMLCNELQIPIVGVGTRDAIRVLHTDPQHASRFDVAELPIWKLDKEFQKLLFQFQGILPLKKCSNLHLPELATKIHIISGGNLGNVHRLLMACAVEAITSGTEQITLEIIERNSWIRPTQGFRKIIG
ncbi:TniB family NTP-binding protein [Mannheimia sp. AT1]|uniref:TniB family NTP-binding protein n=1 Tax=Mannheimia cairinae TaxID=3025936 RepID=A0ABT5MRT4_9PAST|nr:TniB family NTP-binding protein [Mannheimia cairinae]MDD0824291.1 TniB family NTP-binding protein [Mannheimia cairinae]MDD0826586.1 TniB family NTP-binding protein [Mannheimia cairinae]